MLRTPFVRVLLALGAGACASGGSNVPYVVVTVDPNLPDVDTVRYPPVDDPLPLMPPIESSPPCADGDSANACALDARTDAAEASPPDAAVADDHRDATGEAAAILDAATEHALGDAAPDANDADATDTGAFDGAAEAAGD
jgi:hypothetical protein